MINAIEHLVKREPLFTLGTENWWSHLEANRVKLCMYVPSDLPIFHRGIYPEESVSDVQRLIQRHSALAM